MAPENFTETWTACEPGTLHRLRAQDRRRSFRQQLVQRSVAVAGGVVGCIALVLLLFNPIGGLPRGDRLEPAELGSPVAARLTCSEVLDQRDAYLLGNVSAAERERVLAHLGFCLHCEEAYRQRAHELHSRVSLRETSVSTVAFRSASLAHLQSRFAPRN